MLERIKSDKRLKILALLIIGVSFTLLLRMSYAFLNNDTPKKGSPLNKIDFILDNNHPLNILITEENLAKYNNNYTLTNKPKVKLVANNITKNAIMPYNMYLDINNTGFTYQTDELKPVILLTIIKPKETEPMTQLDNLVYKTYNGISGFDITEFNGRITVARGEPISSDDFIDGQTDTWIIMVSYLDSVSEENINMGKQLTANISFAQENAN